MLQEVREEAVVLKLKEACAFSHYYWKEYFDCKEGLAILSHYPLTNLWTNWDDNEDVHNSGSMAVMIEKEGQKIALMNVHLDYKYAHNREIELEKALNHLKTQEADYKIIASDFNTYPRSNLYRFLTGLYTMKGKMPPA
jgi:endonuclease/exonuclease/phosphatase family metal-dependent hydrolase